MLADRAAELTFEEAVKGFFLGVAHRLDQALDGDTTTLVVSDLQVLLATDRALHLGIGKEVSDFLVVDLGVTDPDSDGLVKLVLGQRIHLRDSPGHQPTVLEHRRATSHGVGLTCTCLTIAKNSAVAFPHTTKHFSVETQVSQQVTALLVLKQCFLKVHVSLFDQHINYTFIFDVTVSFKLCTD